MIELADKLRCTGCAACANVCTRQAITMQRDTEGFLQPYIDSEKCVECGLCTKRCPVLHPVDTCADIQQEVYALINHKDRKVSSSGGAFSAFARYVLDKDGVVFGASIDEDFQVKHIWIEDEKELTKLRGSKYVQSNIGDSFKHIKRFLQNGKRVLFTGTPCQVAGLYAYLGGKQYEENLITIDLICHGVPSPGAFDSYLAKLKKSTRLRNENIEGFRFRNLDSWDYRPAVKISKSKWLILTLVENAYMSAFFRGLIFRESCFNCQYCNINRVGTFTIADFWGIGKHGKKFSKNIGGGVSLVIDNHGRISEFMPELQKFCYIEKRSMEEAFVEQSNLKAPMPRLKERNIAVNRMIDPNVCLEDFLKECNLPWRENFKYKALQMAKNIIYFFGLYNVYKTFIYKFGK